MGTQRRITMGRAVWVATALIAGGAMAGSLDPTNGPGPTMHTLDEIYHKIEAMGVPRALSATTTAVDAGFYQATNLAAVESDLVAENISDAVTIFGIAGRAHGSLFSSPAPVTGQTPTIPAYYPAPLPAGADGNLQKGVLWPNPRFTDNGDGTVKDNLTGLIWLKNAGALGTLSWANALTACNTISNGVYGLTDGSAAGDWRLPNVKELYSLMDFRWYKPPVCNTAGNAQWSSGNPFTGILVAYYWSSSTVAGSSTYAQTVQTDIGTVTGAEKTMALHVWPVRGGQ